MFRSLFRKNMNSVHVNAVYRAIVAQSRRPVFYASWDVPDTVNGRFDMISLHLCLLFRRLKTGEQSTRKFSQALFDLFFKDMDRSLREMGAGDMAVPKRIQKMGELFYGLLAKLTAALDGKDREALRATLYRNIYDGEEPDALDMFVNYLIAVEADLKETDVNTILCGTLEMRTPE